MSLLFYGCTRKPEKDRLTKNSDSIVKIEMTLSAFGVESDNFPSIEALIDFSNNTSKCRKSYYNPAFKDSTYSLNKDELKMLSKILQNTDLDKLKTKYTVTRTDQPESTITITTKKRKYKIVDYGLEGESPLTEIYHIVYKL